MVSFGTLVYVASVSELEELSLFQRAYQMLPKERQEKIERIRPEQDKRLSLGAFLLLIFGLEKYGISSKNLRIEYGKEGKPYFVDRKDVHFNLSHSGEYALCAFSAEKIGCDIEKISLYHENLAKRFFSAQEYELLLKLETEEEKTEMFYRLWSLKESFVKAVGKGLYLPLSDFSISFSEGIPELSGEKAEKMFEKKRYHFLEYFGIPEYSCALCGLDESLGEKNGVRFEMVKLSEFIKNSNIKF